MRLKEVVMSRPPQKESHITFSKEHTGSSGQREVDTQRQKAGSTEVEKIGHNPTPTHDVPINKDKK